MTEIDNIIIHSLCQIGCNIDEDIQTLKQFTPELLVSCVSKCLKLIDPALELPSSLPPEMSQKYAVTMRLVEACTKIGFRGDIGYQSFLYSNNVIELRRIMMYLIEKLPKDDGPDAMATQSSADPMGIHNTKWNQLHRQMRHNLSMGLKAPVKCPISMTLDVTELPFRVESNFNHTRSLFDQTSPDTIWSTVIDANDRDLLLLATIEVGRTLERGSEITSKENVKMEKQDSAQVGDKHLDSIDIETEKKEFNESEEAILDPVQAGRDALATMERDIVALEQTRQELIQQLEQMKVTKEEEESKSEQLRREARLKERTLLVMENPEENMDKLEQMVRKSEEKLIKLQEQWEEHQRPLLDQLDEIHKRKATALTKAKVLEDQIQEVRTQQTALKAEMLEQSRTCDRLQEDWTKSNRDLQRSACTERILEIIESVRKQRTDIDKILRDTREVQKEINSISGQLARQFKVTDDLLFSTAKKEDKRAYKHLIALHADCEELVRGIQECGSIHREISDLNYQIDSERARNMAENLQRMSMDLEQMQMENEKLQEKLRELKQQRKNKTNE